MRPTKEDIIDAGEFDHGDGIGRPNLVEVNLELRKNLFHRTAHFLAGAIVLVFLFVICLSVIYRETGLIPDYFIAIVSTVVGFYFSKAFF